MHGVVTYLFLIPLFPRGLWSWAGGGVSCFLCFWFGVSSFVLFPSFFFDAHKSPTSYGMHFARWFGARNVQILCPCGSLVLGVLCVS